MSSICRSVKVTSVINSIDIKVVMSKYETKSKLMQMITVSQHLLRTPNEHQLKYSSDLLSGMLETSLFYCKVSLELKA